MGRVYETSRRVRVADADAKKYYNDNKAEFEVEAEGDDVEAAAGVEEGFVSVEMFPGVADELSRGSFALS